MRREAPLQRRVPSASAAWMRLAVLVFVLAGLTPSTDAAAQTVRGRVVDAETGDGITEAGVLAVVGEVLVGTAITTAGGYFELRLSTSGEQVLLRASRQGYRTATIDSVAVGDRTTLDLPDILLEPSPIVLDEVLAETSRSRLTPGREWIRRNQLLGKGTFFSGAMLRQIDPPSLTRYLATETNLWVSYDERGNPSPLNPFAMSPCVTVLMNRWPISSEFTVDGFTERVGWPSIDEIPVEAIAAVEVYNDMRQLPPMLYFTLRGDAQTCGVVNIWTWDAYH
jgi:hypothetical protein